MPSTHLLATLEARGERTTPVRRALFDILGKHESPLSVQELLTQLKHRHLLANKTTVYRQIETLLRYGIIHEVRLDDRVIRYELTTTDDHHHHLVCLQCKKIEDVSFADDLKRQEQLIRKKKHFKVLRHSLEFFGLCAQCQK